MSGWYLNRNADGEVVNGRVEINRISETKVRSKLVRREGTVMTEVFTKAQRSSFARVSRLTSQETNRPMAC